MCLRKIFQAWGNIPNKDTEEQINGRGEAGSEEGRAGFESDADLLVPAPPWRQGPIEGFGERAEEKCPGSVQSHGGLF